MRDVASPVRRASAARVLYACAALAFTGVLGACGGSCTPTWSTRAWSPDGKWVAESREDVCDAGLVGSAISRGVLLRPAGRSGPETVLLVPEGQWSRPDDVTIWWTRPSELEVTVPNRTMLDTFVPRYRGVTVRVLYQNDDPADRALWVRWVKQYHDWIDSRGPKPGPLPPPPAGNGTAICRTFFRR